MANKYGPFREGEGKRFEAVSYRFSHPFPSLKELLFTPLIFLHLHNFPKKISFPLELFSSFKC